MDSQGFAGTGPRWNLRRAADVYRMALVALGISAALKTPRCEVCHGVMGSFQGRVLGILGSVVGVSSLGGAVSCGGTTEELTPEEERKRLRDDLTDNLCTGDTWLQVRGLQPAAPQEYIALRYMYYSLESAQEFLAEFLPSDEELAELTPEEREEVLSEVYRTFVTVSEETGTCNLTAGCSNNVLPPADGFLDWDYRYHFMAFGNGTTQFVTNGDELRRFLGNIDTPNEAALLASTEGHRIPCDANNYTEVAGGYELYTESGSTCGGDISGHRVFVSTTGELTVISTAVVEKGERGCVIGRFPAGRICLSPVNESLHPVAAYFAQVGQLEASSIVAFHNLAAELTLHGAPEELIRRAESAAEEETDHANLCFALARRYGAKPTKPQVEQTESRDLLRIALDNAVEGLTREAFGALLAHHQAIAAADPMIQKVMQLIALDESGHAEFSLALHSWLMTKLTAEERREVEQARAAAVVRFDRNAHPEYDEPLRKEAGLPTTEVSCKLFRELFSVTS